MGAKYPAIAQSWRRNWELVIPFFAFPEGVRRIIYTTNAMEALNSKLRSAVRGHFPSDDAAMKMLYLVLNDAAAEWKLTAARVGRGEDAIRRHVQQALRKLMTINRPHTEILTVPTDTKHQPSARGQRQFRKATRSHCSANTDQGNAEVYRPPSS